MEVIQVMLRRRPSQMPSWRLLMADLGPYMYPPLVKHEYPWVYFLAHLQLIHSFSERQTDTSAVATVLCSGHNINSSHRHRTIHSIYLFI